MYYKCIRKSFVFLSGTYEKAVQRAKQAEETSTFSDDDSDSNPKAVESSKRARKSIYYAEDEGTVA